MKELTELKTCHRSIEFYLRALWNTDFNIQSIKSPTTIPYSNIAENQIFLPECISDKLQKLNYYYAAATHISAHTVFSKQTYDVKDLNLMQRSLIDLVEDLRVELLALNVFPGLRKIWLDFHNLEQDDTSSAIGLMKRLSRSVLDSNYYDSSQWVEKGKKLIQNNLYKLESKDFSRELGLSLANDLGQMRLPLNSGGYEQVIQYRDDNRHLWYEHIEQHQHIEIIKNNEKASLDNKKLVETDNGKKVDIVDGDFTAGEGMYINRKKNAVLEFRNKKNSKNSSTIFYPEWDYKSAVLKKKWCKLNEKQANAGSLDKLNHILLNHKFTFERLKNLARKLQVVKQQRVRKIPEGDDNDYAPMIDSMISIRMNATPDTRVFIRNEYRQTKSLAISILLDLSESTNYVISGVSISQTLRDAVLLLGETLTIADEQFSIAGFSSNGRHEINYINFKSFTEPFSQTKARLLDIKGQYSTRLGAAIRHTAQSLTQQNAAKKLLLVITDGAPSDIDVYDKQYLEHDSWHAVSSLYSKGIKPFCLNLDSRSDAAIEHIFGKGRFETLEQMNKLPEVLSSIYLKYGRH